MQRVEIYTKFKYLRNILKTLLRELKIGMQISLKFGQRSAFGKWGKCALITTLMTKWTQFTHASWYSIFG